MFWHQYELWTPSTSWDGAPACTDADMKSLMLWSMTQLHVLIFQVGYQNHKPVIHATLLRYWGDSQSPAYIKRGSISLEKCRAKGCTLLSAIPFERALWNFRLYSIYPPWKTVINTACLHVGSNFGEARHKAHDTILSAWHQEAYNRGYEQRPTIVKNDQTGCQ